MTEQFTVGIITSAHGLKGDVNIFPTTDDVSRYDDLTEVLVEGEQTVRIIERVRYRKGRPLIKLSGINSPEDAEKVKGKALLIPREKAVPLKSGEFYAADLIGSGVFLEDGRRFGTLREILKTGANDVYEVQTEAGEMKYIASVHEFIRDVDPVHRKITVRLLKEI